MTTRLVSILQPGKLSNRHIAVVSGRPGVELGDHVELVVGTKVLGNFKVSSVDVMTLGDIEFNHLTGFVYADPRIFRARFESALGCGQPQEAIVSFVTVSIDWEDEETQDMIEDIIDFVAPEPEPVRKLKFDDEELDKD
jgi:hypothetical protein